MQEICAWAVDVAREAGAILRQGYWRVDTAHKEIEQKSSTKDLVTQYDKASEALILARLAATYPDHQVMAEEGGHHHSASPYLWLIDPLDGTTNFAIT